MRVVVYTRVSTDEQIPESQMVEVEKYCRDKGYTIVKVFEEKDVSGAIDPLDRPVFREMLEFVKREGITTIVMYDITRFYRPERPMDAMIRLREIMERYGVVIEFVAEPQIQDPMLEELWRFLKSFIAGYERRMIAQRTKYGIERVKREGRLYHRPTLLHYFAYVYFGKPKPEGNTEGIFRELSPEELEYAARIFVMTIDRHRRDTTWSSLPFVLVEKEPIFRELYNYFPHAPKSPQAYKRAYMLAKSITSTSDVVATTRRRFT
jgi:DNA invertase Pin-like site-specific DNA recombinase